MKNSNNNNWVYESPLLKNKNQRYYYDFGTGNKIEREDVKKQRDAFLNSVSGGSNKPQRDDFLEGFDDPYAEKRERQQKERFANIRANADKRTWSSQSTLSLQTDPFLQGFNQDSSEETDRILGLFNENKTGTLNPIVQSPNVSPAITNTVNPNAKNEVKPIGTDGPNEKSVITQFSNDKTKKGNTNVIGAVFPLVSSEFHKKVWRWGADNYLTKKGYHTSAWLLKHSLQPNPEDVYRGDDSRIAQLIKNDPAFLRELDKKLLKVTGRHWRRPYRSNSNLVTCIILYIKAK